MTEKILELEKWISEILPFGENIDWVSQMTSRKCPYVIKLNNEEEPFRPKKDDNEIIVKYKIYTNEYEYCITAIDWSEEDNDKNGSYLGCIMTCRKHKPGEDWQRGNDLPDGKLTRNTWDEIVKGIIKTELVKVF